MFRHALRYICCDTWNTFIFHNLTSKIQGQSPVHSFLNTATSRSVKFQDHIMISIYFYRLTRSRVRSKVKAAQSAQCTLNWHPLLPESICPPNPVKWSSWVFICQTLYCWISFFIFSIWDQLMPGATPSVSHGWLIKCEAHTNGPASCLCTLFSILVIQPNRP